ncbi:hypothetical protein CYMTET_35518 [Cymbomonas tetramitiformis]|uniref:Uncharacterized protein n=1 Tax=Cymbomonas tetramitiformis TaxID=36881 RepID=A0AAE0F8Z2_9CHLO|nr:hypothetical protein CYMTET_35518 [Cymbomonas tetramitiformis]
MGSSNTDAEASHELMEHVSVIQIVENTSAHSTDSRKGPGGVTLCAWDTAPAEGMRDVPNDVPVLGTPVSHSGIPGCSAGQVAYNPRRRTPLSMDERAIRLRIELDHELEEEASTSPQERASNQPGEALLEATQVVPSSPNLRDAAQMKDLQRDLAKIEGEIQKREKMLNHGLVGKMHAAGNVNQDVRDALKTEYDEDGRRKSKGLYGTAKFAVGFIGVFCIVICVVYAIIAIVDWQKNY